MPMRAEARRRAVQQITAACLADGRRQLTEWESYQLLREWQIPVAQYRLVTEPEQAAEAMAEFDGPVAVKIVSPDIGHKTEAGCVRLGIAAPAQAAAACAEVIANARSYNPDANIHGVLLQRMAPRGVELIAGAINEPSFGPVLVVGMGGIFAEITRDVAFRLAPVTHAQADEMLRELRGFPILTGVRGLPPVDLNALTQTLVILSRLVEAWPQLRELDLNPLIAHEGGVVAVDALAGLKG